MAFSLFLSSLCATAPLAQGPVAQFLSMDGEHDADRPVAQAWGPDGSVLLVVHALTGDVTFIDPQLRARVKVGAGPLDVAVCPVNGIALVPNSLDHSLSVIDVAAALVIETIALSGAHPYQVEIASSGEFAVVTCADSDTVSVVDLLTLTELASFATIEQAARPPSLYPQRPTVYPKMSLGPNDCLVGIAGRTAVAVYDVLTGQEVHVAPSYEPLAVAFGPSARYLAIQSGGFLGSYPTVIDLQLGTLRNIDTCWFGYYECIGETTAETMAVSPTEEVVMFAGWGNLLFCDLETAVPTGIVRFDGAALDISRDGRLAFGAQADGGLTVVDIPSMRNMTPANSGLAFADHVLLHPSGQRVSVLRTGAAEWVDWFDWTGGLSERVASVSTGTLPEGDGPTAVATDASGQRVVTANSRSRSITILDRETGARRAVETGQMGGLLLDVDDAGRLAAVSGSLTGGVTLVDLERGTVVAQIDLGRVNELALSADGKHVYAAQSGRTADGSASDLSRGLLHVVQVNLAGDHRVTRTGVPGYRSFGHNTLSVSRDEVVAITRYSDGLTLVDGYTGDVLKELASLGVERARFSPDGEHVYALTEDSMQSFRVHDGDALPVGQLAIQSLEEFIVSQDGRQLFAVARPYNMRWLYVIDAESMTVTSRAPLGGYVRQIANLGRNVFVSYLSQPDLLHLRVDHEEPIAIIGTLPLPSTSPDILVAPGGLLYAVSSTSDGLDVFRFPTDHRRPD